MTSRPASMTWLFLLCIFVSVSLYAGCAAAMP